MPDMNDMYFYVQVVEYGGFAAASRATGIPKSRLSRRIMLLEKHLGVRLIQRSTRRFLVTDVGQQYYERCRAMTIEAEAAQEIIDVLRAEPSGVIRITCPIGLLGFHVGAMLADFMAKYPRITVHLEATNRQVDLLAEGVDIALRVRPRPLENSDLILRVLSDRGQCLVASPTLTEQYGFPEEPGDLIRLPSLSRSTPHEEHAWVLQDKDGHERQIPHSPRYITTDMLALKSAALAGVGVVQLPLLMLAEELEAGSLIRLLPDWSPRREVIHLVFPSRRGLLPSVRALIDFLAEQYRSFQEA